MTRLRRHAALLLVTAVAGVLAAAQAESAAALCARAVEEGRWREARTHCRESYLEHGQANEGILLARAELQLGNDAEAERLATAALEGPWRPQALIVLGVLHDRAGRREQAREALAEAIASLDVQGNHRELSRARFALAGSFWRDRKLVETLAALDGALTSAQQANDLRIQGLACIMRGDVLRSVGDARSAEREYEFAASRLEGRKADLAFLDLKLGLLRQEEGLLHLSDLAFKRALGRAEETGSQEAVHAARQNLAYNAHLAGNTEVGFAYLADFHGPLDFSHLSVLAMLEADAGRLAEALASMDRAIAVSRSDDMWWGAYERARILERMGDDPGAEQGYEQAIAMVERMRASMDHSELQAWMIARRRRPYEALLSLFVRQGRTAQALRVLEAFSARSFTDALIANGSLLAPPGDAQDVAAAWRLLEQAGSDFDDLGEALAGREVIVPVEVMGRLLVAHKAANGELRFLDRGDAAQIRELAQRFAGNPDPPELAAELGRLLIPEGIEASSQTLHVVVSGWLAAVPFSALRSKGSFLVEQRPIAMMPSLRAFSIERSQGASGRRLVLADVDGTLPSARAEASEIAAVVGTKAVVAEAATSELLETAEPSELLHLGVHAGLDGGGAWLTLADGRWSTDAILASGTSADVVVLAACASAATHHEELWGSLATAFLANGSGSVIASLGSIDDADTRSVMSALYQRDLVHHPVRALAEAQRSVAGRLPPRAWSKFVIYSTANN